MKKLKLLIVGNNVRDWQTWPAKIAALQKWFAWKVNLIVELEHSFYSDIPFTSYDSPDGTNHWLGVDRVWYDQHISIDALGYDIVLFVIPVRQWPQKNRARGWRTDKDLGPIELQIACDEHEHLYQGGKDLGETFHQYARHEIMHALFTMTGQNDSTHVWWDRGQLENALNEIIFIAPDMPEQDTLIRTVQQKIIDAANRVISLLKQLIMQEQQKIIPREQLYQVALESLGKEMSPQDEAPDEVACAESVSHVIRKVHPTFPIIFHTGVMLEHLKADKRFKPTLDPLPGNIILSATGSGNGTIKGHVGIHLGNDRIASNTSKTGLWEDNFSVKEWVGRYRTQGGMKIYYFELV